MVDALNDDTTQTVDQHQLQPVVQMSKPLSEPLSHEYAHTDVLIVGAGPAGLMLGNALSRAGVTFNIVERR